MTDPESLKLALRKAGRDLLTVVFVCFLVFCIFARRPHGL